MNNIGQDFVGMRFGRLTVVYQSGGKINNRGDIRISYMCLCDCGKYKEILRDCLKSERTKSCGCLVEETRKNKENKYKKHGMTNTRLFKIWNGMKARCYSQTHAYYYYYGGRGIKICDSWIEKENGFMNFYNWAIENGYQNDLTIDRINNDLGYFPENCKWSTRKEQSRNRRSSSIIQETGENVTEFSEKNDINKHSVYWRKSHGWEYDKLGIPPIKRISDKQSGIKGVIWNKKQKVWIVKGLKNGKPDTYIKSFKILEEAIIFKKEYDLRN